MKKCALSLSLAMVALAIGVTPAAAQLGGLSGVVKKAQTVKKLSDIKVTDQEERQIGQQVSDKVVQEFGVYQDPAVTKYVTLVGLVLAQNSSRPGLDWQFVVLDTEGVNAFAAPGGFIHITKGLLGLLKNEAELAGVLGHELTHVTEKHTVKAIQNGDAIKMTSDSVGAAGGMAQGLIADFAQKAYENILNNKFSRNDENEADEKGVQLANKVGYAPSGLADALKKLADRNKDSKEPNGLFATHPQLQERITNIGKLITDKKLAGKAVVQQRYAKTITFDAKPASAVSTVAAGSRGLAGGGDDKKADGDKPAGDKPADNSAEKPEKPVEKKEEPKKSGGMFSKFKPGGGAQAQQSQTVASAGARGVNPDRDAVGGANKNRVPVKVTPGDVEEFQKGIVA
jgi:predicted Zn-dependent protease